MELFKLGLQDGVKVSSKRLETIVAFQASVRVSNDRYALSISASLKLFCFLLLRLFEKVVPNEMKARWHDSSLFMSSLPIKDKKKRALSCLWVLTFLTRMAVNKHESNRGSHRLTLLSWGLLAVLVHLSHLLCCRGEKKNNIFLRNINSYIFERCSILLILCFKRGLKFFWTYLNSFRMWRFLNGINRADCFLTG